MIGLSLTTPFASALLLSLTPLFTLLFGWCIGIERVRLLRWLGAGVAFAGVAAFEGAFSGHFAVRPGDVLTLFAALIFFYNLGTARLVGRYSSMALVALTLCIGALMIVPGMVWSLFHQDFRAVTAADWGIFAYAVIVPVVLTYPVWTAGIARLGIARTALYQFLVPVLTGLFSVLLLHAHLAGYQIAGAILCIGGVAIAQLLGHLTIGELRNARVLSVARVALGKAHFWP